MLVVLSPRAKQLIKAPMPKKRPGRPKLSTKQRGAAQIIGLRLTTELRDRLLKWARAQQDKPGQSEAVRRLLEVALKGAGY